MENIPSTPKKKKKSGLVIFLLVILIAIIAAAAEIYAQINVQKITPENIKHIFSFNERYVACLHIEGIIEQKNDTYDQIWLLQTIEGLQNDKRNAGILLDVNSPGGSVFETDEVYLALENYKSVTNRPVWAYFESLAASGGYYMSCAADFIAANRNTWTGSIGVIAGQSIDASQFLEEHGIKITTITAGKNKNMGSLSSPLTDEQKEILQSLADEAYDQFTGIVAQSRKMNIDQVKTLADGRVYSAKQALDAGLIDLVTSFDDTWNKMQDSISTAKNPALIHYRPKEEFSITKYLQSSFKLIKPSSAEEKILSAVSHPEMTYPAYYWEP